MSDDDPGVSAYARLVTTDVERGALQREAGDYEAAIRELRESLIEVEDRIQCMKGLIEVGADTGAILTSFSEPGAVSRSLTDNIARLELARRRTRRQIVLMGQSEGLSIKQLASFWGVSRQLISRYKDEEPRRDDRSEEVT